MSTTTNFKLENSSAAHEWPSRNTIQWSLYWATTAAGGNEHHRHMCAFESEESAREMLRKAKAEQPDVHWYVALEILEPDAEGLRRCNAILALANKAKQAHKTVKFHRMGLSDDGRPQWIAQLEPSGYLYVEEHRGGFAWRVSCEARGVDSGSFTRKRTHAESMAVACAEREGLL